MFIPLKNTRLTRLLSEETRVFVRESKAMPPTLLNVTVVPNPSAYPKVEFPAIVDTNPEIDVI